MVFAYVGWEVVTVLRSVIWMFYFVLVLPFLLCVCLCDSCIMRSPCFVFVGFKLGLFCLVLFALHGVGGFMGTSWLLVCSVFILVAVVDVLLDLFAMLWVGMVFGWLVLCGVMG